METVKLVLGAETEAQIQARLIQEYINGNICNYALYVRLARIEGITILDFIEFFESVDLALKLKKALITSGFKSQTKVEFQLGENFYTNAVKFLHFDNSVSYYLPEFNTFYHLLSYSDILNLRAAR